MIFYLLLVSPGFAESTGNLTFSWPYQSNRAEISGTWPEMFGESGTKCGGALLHEVGLRLLDTGRTGEGWIAPTLW